jgi:hypothetical protein
MIAAGYSWLKLWSWRRDLNPRPSDYKSDALPAELRQPEQPCSLPPNGRITIAKVTTKQRLIEEAAVANPDAIIPRLMRVVNRTLHAQAD